MSNRRSILLLLAGIVLLVAAHFAVDCTDGGERTAVQRETLLDASDTVACVKVALRGKPPVVLVRTNDAWQLTAPYSLSSPDVA